jgi:hypothetical protein
VSELQSCLRKCKSTPGCHTAYTPSPMRYGLQFAAQHFPLQSCLQGKQKLWITVFWSMLNLDITSHCILASSSHHVVRDAVRLQIPAQ